MLQLRKKDLAAAGKLFGRQNDLICFNSIVGIMIDDAVMFVMATGDQQRLHHLHHVFSAEISAERKMQKLCQQVRRVQNSPW